MPVGVNAESPSRMLKKSASGVHERAVPYSARREPQRLNVPPGKSCSGSSGWVGEKEYAPTKTLPAHRLAGAHKRGALSSSRRAPHYSSRRGPRCGLPVEWRISVHRGGRVRSAAFLSIL
jgi:hypothetical protein